MNNKKCTLFKINELISKHFIFKSFMHFVILFYFIFYLFFASVLHFRFFLLDIIQFIGLIVLLISKQGNLMLFSEIANTVIFEMTLIPRIMTGIPKGN